MRINQYIAQAAGLGRRTADKVITAKRITINGQPAIIGQQVEPGDIVKLDGRQLMTQPIVSIIFNKPAGVVCSKRGQGNKTIYDLLPDELKHLKTIGRLDKDSTGLIILTNDGQLIQKLGHPTNNKTKVYKVRLNRPLQAADQFQLSGTGVTLSDGPSQFQLQTADNRQDTWVVNLQAGRNRQIRRSFNALGYKIMSLQRLQFGEYSLSDLEIGKFRDIIV